MHWTVDYNLDLKQKTFTFGDKLAVFSRLRSKDAHVRCIAEKGVTNGCFWRARLKKFEAA